METTQLIITFQDTETGKNKNIKIDDPRDDLDETQVQALAQTIVTSAIFGDLVAKSAKIVTTNVDEMDLVD